MSWYRASTISLTNGSTAVTGAATDFIANCAVGEGLLAPDGKVYEIAAIVSATALTLGSVYLGSTASGQSYAIIPSQSYLRDLALQAATLVNDYQSVLDSAGAGKFGDGTLGSPGIQFSSDSNTGLRRTGTDAVALVTGGVDRITVDAAGAVDVVASLSVAGSAVPTIDSTSTLTNKTLALGSNTVSGTLAQFNTALSDGDFATLAGTETLTNKTLTAPVLANPSYSGVTANGGTVTTIDINGGTIDGTVIGGTTPAAVSATTLSASGFTSFNESAFFNNGKRSYWYEPGTTTWLSMHSPSLNDLDVASSGGTVARFTAGVGLAVTGALSATGKLSAGGDTTYDFNIKTAATAGTNCIGNLIAGNAAQSLLFFSDTDLNGQGRISYYHTNDTLGFSAASLERMVLSSSGLTVTGGISSTGQIDAGQALVVAGSIAAHQTNKAVMQYGGGNAVDFRAYGATPGTGYFRWGVGGGGGSTDTLAMQLDASGNLGLGVTPSAWSAGKAIEVGNVGNGFWTYNGIENYHLNNAYYGAGGWKYASTAPAGYYSQYSGTHLWATAPSGTAGNPISFTTAMTLAASGDLLIGQTTDSGAITQGFSFVTGATSYSAIGHASGSASGSNYMLFDYNGAAIGTITQSGTTAVLYNTSSDQRLKENIVDAPAASDLIDAIQVRSFDWKSDGSHQRYGMVAQELFEVAPEAVHAPADPDEMMAVDYSKLVPMLVKELQSLRARVAQLEGI